MKRYQRKPKPAIRWAAVAICSSAAGVTALYYFLPMGVPVVTYATPVGQSQAFELRDGTRVTLNTNTEIAVSFTHHFRDVQLLSGEALFDVIHDQERPFRVCSSGHLLTDVGTKFNALLSGATTTLTVKEGQVSVTGECSPGKHGELVVNRKETKARHAEFPSQVMLFAGDQALLPAQSPDTVLDKHRLTPGELTRAFAWNDGLLIFDNVSLREALAQINRYFAQQLELADPSLANERIVGTYRSSTMNSILEALRESHGIVALPADPGDPDPRIIRLIRLKDLPK